MNKEKRMKSEGKKTNLSNKRKEDETTITVNYRVLFMEWMPHATFF